MIFLIYDYFIFIFVNRPARAPRLSGKLACKRTLQKVARAAFLLL